MARIRSLKPEFWTDPELTRLPRDVRLLYMALWNFADEEGRMLGDPRVVKAQCFPVDDDVTPSVVQGWLDVLSNVGRVVPYTVNDSPYLFLPKLGRHQRLEPARVPSKLPAPPEQPEPRLNGLSPRLNGLSPRLNGLSPRARGDCARAINEIPIPIPIPEGGCGGEFADFWAAYPRPENEPETHRAWDEACSRASSEQILAGVERWAKYWATRAEPQFVTTSVRFLTQRKWQDTPPVVPNGARASPRRSFTPDLEAAALAGYESRRNPR